jgi:hypothetical protein
LPLQLWLGLCLGDGLLGWAHLIVFVLRAIGLHLR